MIQAHFVIMIHGLLLFYCGFKMKRKYLRNRTDTVYSIVNNKRPDSLVLREKQN